jgi:hypothetical protein
MADQIEQINKILSVPPGGTGDNMYDDAGAIDPREVGVDALNAGALSNEELMMAEEFMNAIPKEAHKGFIDSLIRNPRATIKSVIETLFGGGQEMLRRQMSNDSGSSFDNLVDRTLSGTGTQLKGPLSNSELEMLLRSGDEGLGALGGALGSIGSGSTSNAELDAYRNAMNVEGSGAMTDRELDAFRKMKMNMDVSPPSGPMTDRELDFIRQQQMDMNVSPPSGAGAMTDEERAIRRQRMSMDN